MPTYEYACTNDDCGNRFELVQSFTDPSATECPVCGEPVRKVYGNVGVVFKGSGFYRNDSRGDAGKTKSEAAPAEKSTSSDSSATSSSPAAASSSSSGSTSTGPSSSNGSSAPSSSSSKAPASTPA